MPPVRRIYMLDPQKLSPETIAVTFAKTSRSPQSFSEIAAELTEEKSAEFHEKWVVGYGHASVAEHAVLHLAVEGISRLAVETLESNRLASYTEKSTRYQMWSGDEYHLPVELADSNFSGLYNETCRMLFEAYAEALPAVKRIIQQRQPKKADETEAAWERRIRSSYVDVCRYFLPAAAVANVGVTINARALEHAITKLLSHPLSECQAVGAELRQAALESVPTLVKYADFNPHMHDTRLTISREAHCLDALEGGDWCVLSGMDADCESRIIAASLYRFGGFTFDQALSAVRGADLQQRKMWADQLLAGRGEHDQPLREFEHSSFTFDLLMDQGAYFEVKRHRMMTQTPQRLTTYLGYATPRLMVEAGMESTYQKAMEAAHKTFTRLEAWNPEVASYVVPNGYNRRVLLTLNLRSADHFVALRSAPNAHFAVRRVAQRMASDLREHFPILGAYLRVNPAESWQSIESAYFVQTA